MKVKKVSQFGASEESYQILVGSNVFAQSPVFSDNEINVSEFCMDKTTSLLYTLKLVDSASNSWSRGSYIEVEGISGNIVYKGYMTERNVELHTISLFQPIYEGDVWKFASSVEDDWKSSFNDANWKNYIFGNSHSAQNRTQFYRKTFSGTSGSVAYEVRFRYRYGIVAYMNGNEIYRDHLPSGTITVSTLSEGDYETPYFRGVILPSTLIQENNILAVSIHVPSSTLSYSLDFDAWLALYHPDSDSGDCYVVPYSATVSSTSGDKIENLMNWDNGEAWSIVGMNTIANVSIDYSSVYVSPRVNSLRVYTGADVGYLPNTMVLYGMQRDTRRPTMRASQITYTSGAMTYVYGYFSTGVFNSYQLDIYPPWGGSLSIADLQLAVCNVEAPTEMGLNMVAIETHAGVEMIRMYPVLGVFMNCSVRPMLPSGLTLNEEECVISGVPTTSQSLTSYTLESASGSGYTATFSLTVTDCTDNVVQIRYFNGISASRDFSFSISDADSGSVLFSLTYVSTEPITETQTRQICTTATTLTVTLASSCGFWADGAFIEVASMLESSSNVLLHTSFDTLHYGFPNSYTIPLSYLLPLGSTWFYKFDSVPDEWYTSSISGWESATPGTFPEPTMIFQLFKRTFSMTTEQLKAAGIVLHIKYLAGCVVYLNGEEVFRKHITGDISTSNRATGSYDTLSYRTVSLPIRRIKDGDSDTELIREGSNTIAVGLVTATAIIPSVTFDACIHLIHGSIERRSFDLTITSSGLTNTSNPVSVFNPYYNSYVSSESCGDNYIQVTFNKDRYEWISSIVLYSRYNSYTHTPHSLTVRGCASDGSSCHTLITVSGMLWWGNGQKKRIFLKNSKSFNVYRIEGIGMDSQVSCFWQLAYIELYSDQINSKASTLLYPTSVTTYASTDIPEIYPNSDVFNSFTISPALPSGLIIDSVSGVIMGVPVTKQSPTAYTVTAIELNGETVSSEFYLEVLGCNDGYHIVTSAFYFTLEHSDVSVVLYRGGNDKGEEISSVSGFSYGYQMLYQDFCLRDDLYLLRVTAPTGLTFPAGVMLYVGTNFFVFEQGTVPKASPTPLNLVFSSSLPFYAGESSWDVNTHSSVATEWLTSTKTVSGFTTRPGNDLGMMESTTVYVRKVISISSLTIYNVLNVEVTYRGGLVAYFNGNLMARFNLRSGFSEGTLATTSTTSLSRFHIELSINAVQGSNIFAFEIHRDSIQTSSSPLEFSATGVFGVSECSLLPDTIIAGSDDNDASHDLNMASFITYEAPFNSFVYSSGNLEGLRWNSWGFIVGETVTLSYSLYGRREESDSWILLHTVDSSTITRQIRNRVSVPKGMGGFQSYRVTFDVNLAQPLVLQTLFMEYCQSAVISCAAISGFSAVASGEEAYAPCSYGYGGYAKRTCIDGQWSSIDTSQCVKRSPTDLAYIESTYVFIKDLPASTNAPNVANLVSNFTLRSSDILPAGLIFDTSTGTISGIPSEEFAQNVFQVTAWNEVGSCSDYVNIRVRQAVCSKTELYTAADLESTQVGQCSKKGAYIGTETATCVLGESDGIWQRTSGLCISTTLLIWLVAIVIVILLVFITIWFVSRYSALLRNQRSLRKQLEKETGKRPGSITVNKGYLSVDNPTNTYPSEFPQTQRVIDTGVPQTPHPVVRTPTMQMTKGLGVIPGLRKNRQLQTLGTPRASTTVEMVPIETSSLNTTEMNLSPLVTHNSVSINTPRHSIPASVGNLRPVTPRISATTPRSVTPRHLSVHSLFPSTPHPGSVSHSSQNFGGPATLTDSSRPVLSVSTAPLSTPNNISPTASTPRRLGTPRVVRSTTPSPRAHSSSVALRQGPSTPRSVAAGRISTHTLINSDNDMPESFTPSIRRSLSSQPSTPSRSQSRGNRPVTPRLAISNPNEMMRTQ